MVLLSVSSGTSVGRLRASFFFEPWLVRLSAAKSWVLVEEFPRGAPLPKVPSFTTYQMRPRRLTGAWFSRLLRHPARRWSVSILSHGTYTGYMASQSRSWRLPTKLTAGPSMRNAFNAIAYKMFMQLVELNDEILIKSKVLRNTIWKWWTDADEAQVGDTVYDRGENRVITTRIWKRVINFVTGSGYPVSAINH